jgi:hypothetical protein
MPWRPEPGPGTTAEGSGRLRDQAPQQGRFLNKGDHVKRDFLAVARAEAQSYTLLAHDHAQAAATDIAATDHADLCPVAQPTR